MRHLIKVIVLIFLMIFNYNGHSQPLMNTLNDAQKLKDNEHLFVGQSLKTLLKEIGPEIKAVFVESNRAHKAASYIVFKFTDKEEQKEYIMAGKRSLSIVVSIKENIDWNKPKEAITRWDKEDAIQYEHLTIIRIGIVGESL